jgi:hypothetical protein
MALVRFLQISDLHLGRPFAWLPADRREARRRDQQSALEQAIKHAVERNVHALLIPGDLFDTVPVDTASLAFAVRAFSVPGCPPVFITPGNHDPASSDNAAWNARLQQARGMSWPAHVHVFDTPVWQGVPLATQPKVRVWGRAFLSSSGTMDRPLAAGSLEGSYTHELDAIDVAVFHGSREGRCPPSQKVTAPFSEAEVVTSPFVYHAVGHYHARSDIEQTAASGGPVIGVRQAYAGSPVSLDYTETGDHGALEVSVRFGEGPCTVTTEFLRLDRRRVLGAQADVTGCASGAEVDRRLEHAMAAAGVTADDFVKLSLVGRLATGVRWDAPGADVLARAFHARTDRAQVRPDHDLDALRVGEGRSTEERFARDLLAAMDAATDPEERLAIRRALYYGLDAFRVGEVVPQWEEVSE